MPERAQKKLLEDLLKLKDSSNQSGNLRLRVLVTGQAKTFGTKFLESFPSIDVGKENQTDIEKYLEQKLDQLENLQGDDTENLRCEIRTQLPKQAQGSFFKVQYSLDAIRKEKWEDGIRKILGEADEDKATKLRKEIGIANEQLSTEDIEDLNELLAWVVFGQSPLQVDHLQTALCLRHDKKYLQPLKSRLDDEYERFFEISDEGIVVVNNDLIDFITKPESDKGKQKSSSKPGESTAVSISTAEISMVRKFLRTFCEDDVFLKFGFEEFFAQKAKTHATIGINEKDAHLTIVKRSLKLLAQDNSEKPDQLAHYAFSYLPVHLKSAPDPSDISDSDKIFIETELYRLLTNEALIERRWQVDWEARENWLDDATAMETLWKWLKDSREIQALRETQEGWLTDATTNSNVELRLLKTAVCVMAKQWLQRRKWSPSEICRWVYLFVAKVSIIKVL